MPYLYVTPYSKRYLPVPASTPLNELAVVDAVWARMPVNGPYMNLAEMKSYKNAKEWRLYTKFETNHTIWTSKGFPS